MQLAQLHKSSPFFGAFPGGVCPITAAEPQPFNMAGSKEPVACFIIDSAKIVGDVRTSLCRVLAESTLQPGQELAAVQKSFEQCLDGAIPIPLPVHHVEFATQSPFEATDGALNGLPPDVANAFRALTPMVLREISCVILIARYLGKSTRSQIRIGAEAGMFAGPGVKSQALHASAMGSYTRADLEEALQLARRK